jgi:2-amino-4-hydroxy-6-hydroxymethyldihydropteridine diphosphokinase
MDADYIMVRPLEDLVLLLGSNMGEKEGHLISAINMLEKELGEASAKSSVHYTKPWGIKDQDEFVNQALIIPCQMKPMNVLEIISNIEQKLGRIRYEKWGPRLIDIDIIFYGQLIYQVDLLQIPHPYMQERLFVLDPLAEIAPKFVHPVMGLTVKQMTDHLKREMADD